MKLADRLEIYQATLNALSKGVTLAAKLRERRAPKSEIESVEAKNQKLADTAAKLRRELMKAWKGSARTTLESIRDESGKLQRRIRRIEELEETGEEVVRILGHLDKVISVAAKLLA